MSLPLSCEDRKRMKEDKNWGNLFANHQSLDRQNGVGGLTNQAVTNLIKKGVYTKNILFGYTVIKDIDGNANAEYYNKLDICIKQERMRILNSGEYKKRKW